MRKSFNALVITLFSIFFVIIFYRQMIGFNLFLYNIALLSLLTWVYKVFDFRNKLHIALVSGTILTAAGTLFHASAMVIAINILSLILLFGIVNNRHLQIPVNVLFSAMVQFFSGIFCFFKTSKPEEDKPGYMRSCWKWVRLIIIPIVVLVIFYNLYRASSSKFDSIFGFIGKAVQDFFSRIMGNIDFSIFLLFCFGFIISCAYFVKSIQVTVFTEPTSDQLVRAKKYRYTGSFLGLLSEFRIAVITFILLNLLLAVFNGIDICYVWFNFEWNGEFLKEFVHEGTYILIFTLLISIGLVLIFFRKNLNFFSKNKSLKLLANIWLAQNTIMAVSVLIRNLHYINYYNLAYLRIGVLLFLVIVFFGLITVFIKINTARNFAYLARVNMLFSYVALVLFSLADWDIIIAKFNFSRSEKAFVHLNFMASLDEKALPYLDLPEEEIKKVEENPVYTQLGKRDYHMEYPEYMEIIRKRKTEFLRKYPERSLLEWNYADYRSYKKLTERVISGTNQH